MRLHTEEARRYMYIRCFLELFPQLVGCKEEFHLCPHTTCFPNYLRLIDTPIFCLALTPFATPLERVLRRDVGMWGSVCLAVKSAWALYRIGPSLLGPRRQECDSWRRTIQNVPGTSTHTCRPVLQEVGLIPAIATPDRVERYSSLSLRQCFLLGVAPLTKGLDLPDLPDLGWVAWV